MAVLLLPLAAGVLPHTATTALSVLGRVSADPVAAAGFRGRFVEARSHHRLGANTTPQVLRALKIMNSGVVQGVCVEVADAGTRRWTGATALAAAERARSVAGL